MKWITKAKVKVVRVACQWLVRKFMHPEAKFIIHPAPYADGQRPAARATP